MILVIFQFTALDLNIFNLDSRFVLQLQKFELQHQILIQLNFRSIVDRRCFNHTTRNGTVIDIESTSKKFFFSHRSKIWINLLLRKKQSKNSHTKNNFSQKSEEKKKPAQRRE